MTTLIWSDSDRDTLTRVLPQAVAVLPLGATEQHGPHLPTGTDATIAETVAHRAAQAADGDQTFVLLPTLAIGISEHHTDFGGTLTLTPATMLAVLADLADSVAAAGGRRLLLVNGHGGNSGICHVAAASAAARWPLTVAHVDYWNLLPTAPDPALPAVPGHAGAFETSVMLALRPGSVDSVPERQPPPPYPTIAAFGLHSAAGWQQINGYTDTPELAQATDGRSALDAIVTALTTRLEEFARMP